METNFLDYDGKKFGMAEAELEIKAFKGARAITSLPVYPLKYHRESDNLKTDLIERGKKFTGLGGMQYKEQAGMAYFKVGSPTPLSFTTTALANTYHRKTTK